MPHPLTPDETMFQQLRGVRRILVVSLHCIGDALLTTPVICSLKNAFPDARVTVLAGPTAVPLLASQPYIDEARALNTRDPRYRGAAGAVRMALELRRESYDLIVDLRHSALPLFLRARRRVLSLAARRAGGPVNTGHAVDRHLAVLEAYGFPVTCREPRLAVPEVARETVRRILAEANTPSRARIAVAPGAGSPYKQYPPERLAAVLGELAAVNDAYFLLLGGPGDAAAAETAAARVREKSLNLAGRLSIIETAAALETCRMLITNDSGPMHIAAALGVPVAAVFGPTDAGRYGPRGPAHRIVWRRESCNPCKSPECSHASCIEDVPESDVLAAANEILRGIPSK